MTRNPFNVVPHYCGSTTEPCRYGYACPRALHYFIDQAAEYEARARALEERLATLTGQLRDLREHMHPDASVPGRTIREWTAARIRENETTALTTNHEQEARA